MANAFADFLLDDETREIRDLARQYSDKKIAPIATEIDQKHQFPRKQFEELGELGLLGTAVPEEYGGLGMGILSNVVVLEELARHSGSLAVAVESHIDIGMKPVIFHGTDAQKEMILPDAVSGKNILSFALTEPQSGSDAGGTKTYAVLDGDEWVINGSKSWITNAGESEYYLVACKTDLTQVGKSKGISLIIVPKDAPGFEAGAPENKMSLRASATAQLFFSDCRVPKENLVGPLDRGLPIFLEGLDDGRIAVSAFCIGCAQGALERAVRYAKEREAFGRKITQFQAISFMLAEMEQKVEVARCMCYNVAKMADAGLNYTREAAMLKLYASEMADEVCRDAIQVMGANGISEEYEVERFYRDVKMMTIGEGTSEINKLVISRYVLDKYN